MELKNFLDGKVAVLTHVGDMDACASFVAFEELAKKLNPKVELFFAVYNALNKEGEKILKMFDFKLSNLSADDLQNSKIILIDSQPNILQFTPKEILVIDHHQTSKPEKYINPAAVSATEVIYDLFKNYKIKPSKNSAKAIIFGLISDTAGLRFAKNSTFKILFELLEICGIEYQDILAEIYEEKELQERIAWLKAAQRLKIKQFGNKLLVTSKIGGFESSAASKLITLGGDVVLMVSHKPKETRIVGRARKGFDLAKIFIKVSEKIGGTSGGHPGAAVLNIPPEKEEEALNLISRELN